LTPYRRASDLWRPFIDDKSGPLQMLNQATRDNLRHDLIGVVNALGAKASDSARSSAVAGVSLSGASDIARR